MLSSYIGYVCVVCYTHRTEGPYVCFFSSGGPYVCFFPREILSAFESSRWGVVAIEYIVAVVVVTWTHRHKVFLYIINKMSRWSQERLKLFCRRIINPDKPGKKWKSVTNELVRITSHSQTKRAWHQAYCCSPAVVLQTVPGVGSCAPLRQWQLLLSLF